MTSLDTGLLHGFRFECRPGCGLCCYANPAVTAEERPALLRILPSLELLDGEDGYSFLGNRADGGACDLLEKTQCSGHSARPFPCRSFPISVHLGPRAQASLVLSCPGLSLDALDQYGGPGTGAQPVGLDAELDAVVMELARPPVGAIAAGAALEYARGLERQRGRPGWIDPEEFRVALRGRSVGRELTAYPEAPPSDAEGPDALPVTFVPDLGVVNLGGENGQWTVRTLHEEGAGPELGTYDLDPEPPRLEPAAVRLLDGYLRYAFDRDAPFGQLLLELRRSRLPWDQALWNAVSDAAGQVVTRAVVLAMARGEPGTMLGRDALRAGIQASDADLLDRPTLGAVL